MVKQSHVRKIAFRLHFCIWLLNCITSMMAHRNIQKCLSVIIALFIGVYGEIQKNVLFIVADDLRPQIEAWDGPYFPSPIRPKMHTPHLDALASRSLVLKQSFCQQALCNPSRTSLLTGRRPDTTHVYDLRHYFRKVGGNFTTLPQYFKQNGYTTVGMGKIFHPGMAASGNDDPLSWTMPYYHGISNFESRENSWVAVPDGQLKDKPLIDDQIAEHAVKTLNDLAPDARAGKKPFFVAVGFHKPHLPFVFPESVSKYYPMDDIRLPNNPYAPTDMPPVAWSDYFLLRTYSDIRNMNITGAINTTLPDKNVLELRRAYYSAVTWMDSLVGRVVTELDKLGLLDSTIIAFIGDHGFQLGEHGEWGKVTNFELATHAPMMVRIPGLTDNGVSTGQLTEFVDLFPTLVDAAGLPQLELCPEDSSDISLCREGSSLLPLINQPLTPIKLAAFSQFPRENNTVMGYTIRNLRYRYTEWVQFEEEPIYKPNWDKLSGRELYDHLDDPEENHNLVDSINHRVAVEYLSFMLRAGWRAAKP